ncbi:MAG TPA: hypothetical protein VMZ28_24715 [Kofleriaceae bacterium]|nr:hypothetical protein [Kofleriaceae bacterium]
MLGIATGCGDNLGPARDAAPEEPDSGPDAGADPGVTVTPTSGLVTTEAGGEDTFTVVLDAQPTSDVEIALSSSDTGEGTVSPDSLSFDEDNWNAPRTVTVKGVDDDAADGDTTYMIELAAASSDDGRYDGLDPDDVEVTNDDDETPGVTVAAPDVGIVTNENGSTDTFTIVLDSQPTDDVTIDVSSGDDTEGSIFPESVTFTPDNWNAPQEITVTGVDDDDVDGPIMYEIVTAAATSADDGYDGLNPDDVDATNIDDDSPGVTIIPGEDPMATGEDGDTATFTVTLNSQPTGDVTITLASDDEDEGTVDPTEIVFTTENWNSLVEVTVTGQDDDLDDLDQPYAVTVTVTSADDAGYDGLAVPDVELVNVDDDSPGVTVEPLTDLFTTESGGTATFTVTLNSQPTDDVTITLFSESEDEGTVDPIEIVFTPINWNSLVEVTVTGVNDNAPDGNQLYLVNLQPAESDDPGYDGIDPPNVSVTNIDNDTPGTIVSPLSITTSELGETGEFTVVLTTQPIGDVEIDLTSSAPDEGTVDQNTLLFTTLNWDEPQLVVVTGINDALIDGNQPYTIITGTTTSIADPDYQGLPVDDVAVVNIDDESPFLVIQPRRKLHFVNENGTVDSTLQIRLSVQPTADVTCTFGVSDSTEGDIDLTTLTFTTGNWNVRQDIIVSGVDDDLVDGDQRFNVITNPCTSTDLAYSGFDAVDIPVLNRDNEPPP